MLCLRLDGYAQVRFGEYGTLRLSGDDRPRLGWLLRQRLCPRTKAAPPLLLLLLRTRILCALPRTPTSSL